MQRHEHQTGINSHHHTDRKRGNKKIKWDKTTNKVDVGQKKTPQITGTPGSPFMSEMVPPRLGRLEEQLV